MQNKGHHGGEHGGVGSQRSSCKEPRYFKARERSDPLDLMLGSERVRVQGRGGASSAEKIGFLKALSSPSAIFLVLESGNFQTHSGSISQPRCGKPWTYTQPTHSR